MSEGPKAAQAVPQRDQGWCGSSHPGAVDDGHPVSCDSWGMSMYVAIPFVGSDGVRGCLYIHTMYRWCSVVYMPVDVLNI